MMAALPHPTQFPTGEPPRLAVRLDVRMGGGRATQYALEGTEFLVGGAAGCDLRLPGAHTPPVICQVTRHGEELRLRRLAAGFPIMLNGAQLSGPGAVLLGPGDRISVGPAEVTVNIHPSGHLHPHFVPQAPAAAAAAPPGNPLDYATIHQQRQELEAYRARLEEQARELEADRVAWYHRRQQIEHEHHQHLVGEPSLAAREQAYAARVADLVGREEQLAANSDELARIRQALVEQYQTRREQLAQMQSDLQQEAAARQVQYDRMKADLGLRGQLLEEEVRRIQESIESEVARRVSELETDIRRRKIELEVEFDSRLRSLETDAASREQQFADGIQAVTLTPASPPPSPADLHELDAQRQALAAMRQELDRERQALDAERHWHEERRQEQDALLAAREDEVARREDQIIDDRQAIVEERRRQSGELTRLESWQSALDERQRGLDHRAKEIDTRAEQLARDAVELEQQITLFQVEQQQTTAESERLERFREELDVRAARTAERAAQVEAQQATLAVLRARLDRQEHDLQREAAQLVYDRGRADAAQKELDDRLREADLLRQSLSTAESHTSNDRRAVEEQTSLLEATMAEIRQQRDALAAEDERLRARAAELDARSTDMAEQTAVLTAKLAQVMELQQRLEVDRSAVRERESGLSDAESARVTFQDQLRRRSEDLAARSKQLDEALARLADERLELDQQLAAFETDRAAAQQALASGQQELGARADDLDRAASILADREAALSRQVHRLQEAGRSVAAGRKQLFESRQALENDRSALDEFRSRMQTEVESLRRQAPELEDRSTTALARLSAARDLLRGQLTELHSYAAQTRDTLDAVRSDLRVEADRLREREAQIERARSEHRLAVAEFRQQLLDWQARVGDLRTTINRSESRIEAKQAALDAATRQADETAQVLVRQAEHLRIEQERVTVRRTEVERHLSDMREWYRAKMRELAVSPQAPDHRSASSDTFDLEPGDRHLGELLRSLELVDAETLAALWAEAGRQNRTLRQVLLASGTITLYQLALIEAGNLDSLMMGRFRVVDRVRLTPREAVYRVYDPTRGGEPALCILRILGDHEIHDATHPDEFRQQFALAASVSHPNLTRTLEILEINGRPAVLQEWLAGVPGSEWTAEVATPAIWLRTFTQVVSAFEAAHQVGLVHGRLTVDAIVLTPAGEVKVNGFGEPTWLSTGLPAAVEPTPESDLRALGRVASLWAQAANRRKGRGAKGLPEPLLAVLQKLTADPRNPMDDTVSAGIAYESASELLAHLHKLAAKYPCSADAWHEFVVQATEGNGDDSQQRAAG